MQYLVLITFVTGDTSQESFDSKRTAFGYASAIVDYVKAVEVKRAQ